MRSALPAQFTSTGNRQQPAALFFGALGLTAIADNAALTYLGSLIEGMSDEAKYMLVAGVVADGGLTVIANAPHSAGAALLRSGFSDESIGLGGLLLGALLPTAVAAVPAFCSHGARCPAATPVQSHGKPSYFLLLSFLPPILLSLPATRLAIFCRCR